MGLEVLSVDLGNLRRMLVGIIRANRPSIMSRHPPTVPLLAIAAPKFIRRINPSTHHLYYINRVGEQIT